MNKSKLTGILLSSAAVLTGAATMHHAPKTKTSNKVVLTQRTTSKGSAVVIDGNGSLVLKSEANSSSAVSSYLSSGEMLTINSQSGDFYNVTVQETGATGFISAANIQIIENGTNDSLNSLNEYGQVVNVSSSVHLRANASLKSSIVGFLQEGNTFKVLGKEGQWFKVDSNGTIGYIYQEYVSTSVHGEAQVATPVQKTAVKVSSNTTTANTTSTSNSTQTTTTQTKTSNTNTTKSTTSSTTKQTAKNTQNQTKQTKAQAQNQTAQATSFLAINPNNSNSTQAQNNNNSNSAQAQNNNNSNSAQAQNNNNSNSAQAQNNNNSNSAQAQNNNNSNSAQAQNNNNSNNNTQASNATGQAIVNYAEQYLGTPYVWGATGPNAFDCSGLTSYVYSHFGYNIGRTTYQQVYAGTPVSVNNLQAGDLIFWGPASAPYHVAIYIGGGQYIQAPHPGANVDISSWNLNNISAARRIL